MALFAVARERAIGIDVEHCRPFPGAADLARRFFSQSEYAAMRSSSRGMQTYYFYSLWTCKEACIKATGEGLARLDSLEIAIPQDGSTVSLVEGVGGEMWSDWTLRRLDPPAGDVAALAVQGEGWNLIEIPDAMAALGG